MACGRSMSWSGSSRTLAGSRVDGSSPTGSSAIAVDIGVGPGSVGVEGATGSPVSSGLSGPGLDAEPEVLSLAGEGTLPVGVGLPVVVGLEGEATDSAAKARATGLEAFARSFARSLARSAPLRCALAPPLPSGPSSPASRSFAPAEPAGPDACVEPVDAVEVDVVEVVTVEVDAVENVAVEVVGEPPRDPVLGDELEEVDALLTCLEDRPGGGDGRDERAGGDAERAVEDDRADDPARAVGWRLDRGAALAVDRGAALALWLELERCADGDAFAPLPDDEACAARPGGAASAPATPTVAVSPSAARTAARIATVRNPPPAVVTRTSSPWSRRPVTRGSSSPWVSASRGPG
jgi:hypothetical protein